jgi:hypothetical protein
MLAFVLLFRILVPAGYMIAPSDGWPVLTLCEAATPGVPDEHGGHHPASEPKPSCAYAALASPALPPAPPSVGIPPLAPEPAPAGLETRDSFRAGPASLPPPATGPPHRV